MFEYSGIFQQQEAGGITLPTPYAFWPMQEGTGATLNDAIGNRDMTIAGATWTTGRNGSTCLSFGDYQWAYVADPFYTDVFSLSVWFYPTSLGVEKTLIAKRNNSSEGSYNNEFAITYRADNAVSFVKWVNNSVIAVSLASTYTAPQNSWSNVIISSGGPGAESIIYLNGVYSGTGTQVGNMNNTTSVLQIAGRTANNNSRYFQGKMQEVRIYNTALTAEQCAGVYNLTTP